MSKNLRTYLRETVARDKEAIKQIDVAVDRKFGIPAYATRLAQQNRSPGLYFTNVEGSRFPLVCNLMATYERYAQVLGCEPRAVPQTYGERIAHPIPPIVVPRAQAPCKEVVLTGDAVDLGTLPIPWHNELDGGPYIDAAMMTSMHPDTGALNVGIYRMMVFGPREVTAVFAGSHHAMHIHRAYEERNERMPVAMAIGHHPGFMMGAVAKLPRPGGEYDGAGALLGEPVELVESETTPGLLVPAQAEFVIEGYIEPHVRHEEGPFGEWPGYYLGFVTRPVITITTITHRRDAIYQDVIAAQSEHQLMGAIPRAGSVYRNVKEVVPGITAVNIPVPSRMHCYIALKRFKNIDVKRAALAALNTSPDNLRLVIVVDDDVDVFDDKDVLWAIGTRFDAERDLTILPEWSGPGGPMPINYTFEDDGTDTPRASSAAIVDATKPPPPKRFPPRSKVPDADVAKVDLATLVPFVPTFADAAKETV